MSVHLFTSRPGARLILAVAASGALAAQLLVVNPAAAGVTTPTCHGRTATIFGQSGNIAGTPRNDVIVGSGSSDTIDGRGGNDTICGAGGDDTLIGGPGNDRLFGAGGGDDLTGGAGNDLIVGGPGQDMVRYTDSPKGVHVILSRGFATGEGQDQIRDVEVIDGSHFADWLRVGSLDIGYSAAGREGADTIIGGLGNDSLFGNEGADTIRGGGGKDIINGGEAADQIFGGDGRDFLNGDVGADKLDGGRGSDLCIEGPSEVRCERNKVPEQP